MTTEQWQGRLLLAPAPGMVAYLGPAGPTDEHAHHAIQIAVGVDAPVVVRTSDRPRAMWACVVGQDQPHSLSCDGGAILVFVDAASAAGRRLSTADPRGLTARLCAIVRPPSDAQPLHDPTTAVDRLLRALGCEHKPDDPPARAVASALDYVDTALGSGASITLQDAARRGAISPSYLTHQFTREVGIPFRRYVLWRRLVCAIEHIAAGANLTRAAAAGGFSDSAHLSRTFRSSFGLSPSTLLRMRVTPGQLTGTEAR